MKELDRSMSKCKESVDHEGNIYKSISAMCDKYGVSIATYSSRIKSGLTVEEALTKESHQNVRDHLGNEYNSFSEMCLAYNKTIDAVRYRIAHNWSLEDALTSDIGDIRISKRYVCKDHLGNIYVSKSAMCSQYNISKALFDYRIRHNWSLKDALTVNRRKHAVA